MRPSASHARASVESRASRVRSAVRESPGADAGAPPAGAWNRATSASRLERDVPMLLGRIPVPLRLERGEGVNQAWPRVARVDDVVEVAAGRGEVGMRELLPVFRLARFRRLVLVQDLHRAL